MTTVVATHGVGDMDVWLAGGDDRREIFKAFCSSYRIFKHAERNEVSLVWENVDLEKMTATLGSPEALAAREKHTVLAPLNIYIEVENGT